MFTINEPSSLKGPALISGYAPRTSRVSRIKRPSAADPSDPFEVSRSHLMKMELGKSSSSCKVSLVTRLHRSSMLQEFWCASFEEACVYENLAAHPDVVNFAEQFEPGRVCRRLQLLSRMEHHEQDNEQVFP